MSNLNAVVLKLDTLIALVSAGKGKGKVKLLRSTFPAIPLKAKGVSRAGVVKATPAVSEAVADAAYLREHIATTLDAARKGIAPTTCPWDGNIADGSRSPRESRADVALVALFAGCKHSINVFKHS